MAQNDNAVVTAAVGYVFVAPTGTARPTPSALASTDPTVFGAQTQTVKVTGSPTGGTFTLTANAQTTSALASSATVDEVQAALEALASVGAGNVVVTGTLLTDTNGYDVSWVGSLQGTSATLTGTASFTGGTTPGVTITSKTAASGWKPVGHTSRGDMPEFGFDGGKPELKGTWQNEALREVLKDPIADFLTMFLQQFDTGAFELYYGENASSTAGVFGVANGDVKPVEKAFLVIIVDGDSKIGFYAPKASVTREAAIKLPADDFASLPIKATFLKHARTNKFEWINEDLFT